VPEAKELGRNGPAPDGNAGTKQEHKIEATSTARLMVHRDKLGEICDQHLRMTRISRCLVIGPATNLGCTRDWQSNMHKSAAAELCGPDLLPLAGEAAGSTLR